MTIIYSIHRTEIKIKIKALLEYKTLFRGCLWLQILCLQFITTLEETKDPATKRPKPHLTYCIYLSRLLSPTILVSSLSHLSESSNTARVCQQAENPELTGLSQDPSTYTGRKRKGAHSCAEQRELSQAAARPTWQHCPGLCWSCSSAQSSAWSTAAPPRTDTLTPGGACTGRAPRLTGDKMQSERGSCEPWLLGNRDPQHTARGTPRMTPHLPCAPGDCSNQTKVILW